MRTVVAVGLGLVLGAWTAPAWAAEITLGRPIPIASPVPANSASTIIPASYSPPPPAAVSSSPMLTLERPVPLVRAQAADGGIPPPPFPGGAPPPGVPGAAGAEEAYNCGVVGAKRGFFGRCWDGCQEWAHGVPGAVTGIFQPGPGRGIFQSDHTYDEKGFISPVTDPFRFEDPRALTEVRPIFIWQRTPVGNPVFAGGDNFFGGLQARLAVTDWFSVVVNKLGWVWTEPQATGDAFENHAGFAELWLGPKFTFYRGECCVWAAGLTFEIPTGPTTVFQDTGSLSLDPYFSFAWAFGRTTCGSFNFMNTTGYSFATDSERTDVFHSHFHLSYDVMNMHKFFPLVELNWTYYPFDGGARPLTFEGRDMFNFGSTSVAGQNELTVAVGARYQFSPCFQIGVATEFNVLGGSRTLDQFRVTADMIFRY